jgi:hypothetical protein
MGSNAHGLCIYHVDENVFSRTFWRPNEAECVSGGTYWGQTNCMCDTMPPNSNNGERWYGISVEQADGLYQMELGTSSGDHGDFFGTGYNTFDAGTTPNTSSYYRHNSCTGFAAATNITEVGQNISLDLTPDAVAPTMTLTYPVGGEVFTAGSTEIIQWSAGDNLGVASISIYYGINGDTSCPNLIASGEANDGAYSWTVPMTGASDCYIRVVAYDDALNQASDINASGFTMFQPTEVPALSTIGLVILTGLFLGLAALLIKRKSASTGA